MSGLRMETWWRRRGAVLLAGMVLATCVFAGDRPQGPQPVSLDVLSPLAASDQLVDRLLSPVTQLRIDRYVDRANTGLATQSIHAGEESFDLFVPATPGPAGYGVMVYIWPGDEMSMPFSWRRLFEARHLIFIAARRSGNGQNVLERRLPLALHGLEYAKRHYRIDPERVYLGGFSGGSRVAQKLALGYPDVFRSLMLAGGSDPIGTAGFVPPSRELMRLFQRHTRIVFATGTQDLPNRTKDARTHASFADFCVRGVRDISPSRTGHWVPEDRVMARVLDALEEPVKEDAAFSECDRALETRVRARLDEVQRLSAGGSQDEARDKLAGLDELYGGLAAPDSLRLAETLYPVLRTGEAGDATVVLPPNGTLD
jgi:pimeloyl-ACP methyl ester carboxylesterase